MTYVHYTEKNRKCLQKPCPGRIHKLDKNIFYNHKITAGRGDMVKVKLFKKIIKFIVRRRRSCSRSMKKKSGLK